MCFKKLQDVQFNHHVHRKTVLQAHLDLLVAIRDQAVNEGDLATWEGYWLDEPWLTVWGILREIEGVRSDVEYRQSLLECSRGV